MIHVGQLAAWPKLKFIANRMAIEKVIEEAREATRPVTQPLPTPMPDDERTSWTMMGGDDLQTLLDEAKTSQAPVEVPHVMLNRRRKHPQLNLTPQHPEHHDRSQSPSFSKRFSGWLGTLNSPGSARTSMETVRPSMAEINRATSPSNPRRRGSMMEELKRQTSVFWDDPDAETTADENTTEDEEDENAVLMSEREVAEYSDGEYDSAGSQDADAALRPQITITDQYEKNGALLAGQEGSNERKRTTNKRDERDDGLDLFASIRSL